MKTMQAAALCLVLAASALGQDDAETRFHRAYEQEVIEGKTADAARVYLAMMGDAAVPARLRQESKFRFAVTATLLGRADEARAHFAELAKDASAPESLRARAAEYLDAAKGIGVGSELDKKLQALVFDLAKADSGIPPAYRDIEVIGRRAVPFLKQLLQHEDPGLRRHAFRLLVRLKEPGMGELWTPALMPSPTNYPEFGAYLREFPAETAALEKQLLSLADATLVGIAAYPWNAWSIPTLSPDFFRAAAARKAYGVVTWLDTIAGKDQRLRELRLEWIRGEDAELSRTAVLSALRSQALSTPPGNPAAAGLFPVVVRRLIGAQFKWAVPQWRENAPNSADALAFSGFLALARSAPMASLLDALEAATAADEAAKPNDANKPAYTGLSDALALVIDEGAPTGDDLARYAALLRRRWSRGLDGMGPQHARLVLTGLPVPQAVELATWLFTPTELTGGTHWTAALPVTDAERLPVVLAAHRAASPKTKTAIAGALGLTDPKKAGRVVDPKFAGALLAAWPELVHTAPRDFDAPVAAFARHAALVPAEEARARLVELVEALSTWNETGQGRAGLSRVLSAQAPDDGPYLTDVVLPAMDEVWSAATKADRDAVFHYALAALQAVPDDAKVRGLVARFALAHLDEAPRDVFRFLISRPDVFPPASWVPRLPESKLGGYTDAAPKDAADAAAREMTQDPAAVTDSVIAYVLGHASPAVKTEVLDRLLRTAPRDRMPRAAFHSRNANAQVAEEALLRELGYERPNLGVMQYLVDDLSERRPSERLVPAVRLLLEAGDPWTEAGIRAAMRLGLEELLPSLARALDSLDPTTRLRAKEAIDSIVALRKLREEAKRAADGK
jgi:hypothetical protein